VLQADRDGAQRAGWLAYGGTGFEYPYLCVGRRRGKLETDEVTVCFVTKCGFVYCKDVTGGRKRGGRRLGTHGKSETNKEQKEGRQKEDRKCERKIKLQTKVKEQKSKRNMNRTQGGVRRHGGMMLQVRNFVGR